MYLVKQSILCKSMLLFIYMGVCVSVDLITQSTPIKDGDVLVSGGGVFALGFFTPGESRNRYVGIWYNKLPERTVVWVANRDNPIAGNSGVLYVDKTGNLVLRDGIRNVSLWATNVSSPALKNGSLAQLMDTGNFVLFRDDGGRRVLSWQSFDFPTDTVLPHMKFGIDRRTGLNRFLTSWTSRDNPGSGDYSFKMDIKGSPQVFLNKGLTRLWRTGPWNGLKWSGVPEMTPNFIFNISYIDNENEVSMMYSLRNASILSRLVVNESGTVDRLTWHGSELRWVGFWSVPKEQCDYYSHCGVFSNCDPLHAGKFECTCLPGFEPKMSREWYLRDGSGGCVRKPDRPVCGSRDGFVKLARVKVPDTSTARVERDVGAGACEDECKKNCSCNGYSSINGEGDGCIHWFGELVDTRQFYDGGQDFFIRVDPVELAEYSRKPKSIHSKELAAIIGVPISVLLVLVLSCWLLINKRKGNYTNGGSTNCENGSSRDIEIDESTGRNTDLRLFDLKTIIEATDNFSQSNKLGEGGFGSVYKGELANGEEIAVKRLSKNSGQGVEEFKNEVTLIARLQHRNLVKLLGCCVQQEEKMLVYEYLPNKGLDTFIFNKEKAALINWRKRMEIAVGIARGMIYLHQDSRLRIIHRDLKASNVLLDAALNPKISDFGMARIFGGDQVEANTNRVVGTYGYMSPEYAMEGQFSVKSDVFSFGVLLLEIISGKKNNTYYHDNDVNLIGHVWDLWRQGKAMDIVDESYGVDDDDDGEVVKCIQIGLLCVQESAHDRPKMSEVGFMLSNTQTTLSSPNQPAFIFRRPDKGPNSSSASAGASSVNNVTITVVEPR